MKCFFSSLRSLLLEKMELILIRVAMDQLVLRETGLIPAFHIVYNLVLLANGDLLNQLICREQVRKMICV
ncbi:hypothetical protein LINPERPRIM_LOCUS36472 [Linum perenne]